MRFTADHGSVKGEGTIKLIWLGIEETVDIETDEGRTVSCYPVLGDQITVIEAE